MSDDQTPAGEPGNEPQATLEIRDLDRLRLLADPLRLRLLQAFAERARTTKQVAELLQVPPTRLYHHVGQLESAGLIRLVRTRPVRGTVEKYYRAVARRFFAAPGAFSRGPEGDAIASLAAQVIDQTRADAEVLWSAAGRDADEVGCEPLVARATITTDPRRLSELRERMMGWLAELEAFELEESEEDDDGDDPNGGADEPDPDGPTDEKTFSLTLAFLPTEIPE